MLEVHAWNAQSFFELVDCAVSCFDYLVKAIDNNLARLNLMHHKRLKLFKAIIHLGDVCNVVLAYLLDTPHV
jgi:hypothetical protein